MQRSNLYILCLLTLCIIALEVIYLYHCHAPHKTLETYAPQKQFKAKHIMRHVSNTWQTDPVPHIIHQTAPANQSKWHVAWKPCQASWQKIYPNYTYRMWTDEDIDEFIRTHYPKFYPLFKSYPHHIQRVDVVRYFILYEFGGIYADMDYMVLKSFEHLLPAGKVSIAESPHGRERFQNALMASPPNHPFWRVVLDECITVLQSPNFPRIQNNVLQTTGPQVIVRSIDKVPEMVNPLPIPQFNPIVRVINTGNTLNRQLEEIASYKHDVYAIHTGTTVWAR
jgi:mannosyltransferase OCH1-like enzyme